MCWITRVCSARGAAGGQLSCVKFHLTPPPPPLRAGFPPGWLEYPFSSFINNLSILMTSHYSYHHASDDLKPSYICNCLSSHLVSSYLFSSCLKCLVMSHIISAHLISLQSDLISCHLIKLFLVVSHHFSSFFVMPHHALTQFISCHRISSYLISSMSLIASHPIAPYLVIS